MGTRQWQAIAAVMLSAIGLSAVLVVTVSSTSPAWATTSQFTFVAVMTAALAASTRIAGLWRGDAFPHGSAAVILLVPVVLYGVPIAIDQLWSFDLWPEPLKVLWGVCCLGSIPVATVRWGSDQAIVVAWVGLWAPIGGFATFAAFDSLLHPSHAINTGPGIENFGNTFVLYLAALSWLGTAAVFSAVLVIVLAIQHRVASRVPPSAYPR